MTTRSLVYVTCLLALSACSTSRGFDRGALEEELAAHRVVTEQEIREVLELEPQLPAPFRLAIFFQPPESYRGAPMPMWSPEDKQRLVRVGESLVGEGIASDAIFIGNAGSRRFDLKAVRLSAARHGADAVLVVSGVAGVDRYNNWLGPTYAGVLTMFFVPGTVADALFVSQASLWDVGNGYLYASVEADGEASMTRPAALMHEEAVVASARERSIEALAEAAHRHVANLRRPASATR